MKERKTEKWKERHKEIKNKGVWNKNGRRRRIHYSHNLNVNGAI
jgi:hypothetical protein